MDPRSIKSVVNKILWDPSLRSEDFKAVYVDRFENSYKEFSLADVERVEGGFVALKSGAFIPLHRIKKIYNIKTGATLLSR
ncbi:MAG: RNA repair domain-containing protein [Candidatus Jordarchaeales archaeon]